VTDLNVELLPWQTEVYSDPTRFKVVAAGRRTGKSRLAAWLLIINALQTDKGQVFYVAPTQGQARDIMWQTLLELGNPVITGAHINNLQIKLVNGATISLKGADRPETMRGVSLKFLVMDEYADMKPDVWEQILRPALAEPFWSASAGRRICSHTSGFMSAYSSITRNFKETPRIVSGLSAPFKTNRGPVDQLDL